MRRFLAASCLLVLGCVARSLDVIPPTAPGTRAPDYVPTPEQSFFDWTALQFSAETYAARRERLVRLLRNTGGGVLLIPSRAARSHGETFRQLNDFEYLTGLELPDSVLAVDANHGESILFLPRVDSRFENPARSNDFPGRKLGADPRIAEHAGISQTRPIGTLEETLGSWTTLGREVRLARKPSPVAAGPQGWRHPTSEVESLAMHLEDQHPDLPVRSAWESLAALRAVKEPAEIAAIRRACAITSSAIIHAAGFVRDRVDERTLEAELEAEFKRQGAQRRAFDSIIKSGPNSLWPWRILAAHYDRRNRSMRNGELVVFDVGCELDHYASDVGRTFPVSGRFLPEQRRRLEMITDVSAAILAAVRPGQSLRSLQDLAEARIPEAERPYMQTGLFFGHPLGLNVGDPIPENALLEPGMVFTVEPWYYNHVEGISVFLEDVVVVTPDGCENLTAQLPRDPEALERMVGAAY